MTSTDKLVALALTQSPGSYLRTMTLAAAGVQEHPRTGKLIPLGSFVVPQSTETPPADCEV